MPGPAKGPLYWRVQTPETMNDTLLSLQTEALQSCPLRESTQQCLKGDAETHSQT